jgi:hypothetical protein
MQICTTTYSHSNKRLKAVRFLISSQTKPHPSHVPYKGNAGIKQPFTQSNTSKTPHNLNHHHHHLTILPPIPNHARYFLGSPTPRPPPLHLPPRPSTAAYDPSRRRTTQLSPLLHRILLRLHRSTTPPTHTRHDGSEFHPLAEEARAAIRRRGRYGGSAVWGGGEQD